MFAFGFVFVSARTGRARVAVTHTRRRRNNVLFRHAKTTHCAIVKLVRAHSVALMRVGSARAIKLAGLLGR